MRFTTTNNTIFSSIRKAAFAGMAILAPVMASATNPPVPGNQDWEWVRKGSGCNFDRTNKVSTDICGYVYAAGSFHDTAGFTNQGNFKSMHLTSNGGRDGFLAKYSAQGRLLWVAKMGGLVEDEAWDVSARWDGVYVTGFFQGASATVHSAEGTNGPSKVLTNAGGKDMFVAKYNTNGSLLWAYRFGGAGNDESWSISASLLGDVYFGGNFEQTVAFKGAGTGSKTLVSAGSMDGCMIQIDANGNVRDAFRFGGSGNDIVYGVTSGIFSTYFCGTFENSAYGNAYPSGTRTIVSNGAKDAFIGKFNACSDSKLDWVKGFGGTGNDIARQTALYLNGDLTLTGYFNSPSISFPGKTLTTAGGSDVMVVQYRNNGSFDWATRFGGVKDDEGRGIANNLCGDLFLAGMFQETASDESGNMLTSAGNKDVLVWKLSFNGQTKFLERAGGNIEDQGRGIAILGRGAVVGGMYFRYASFGQETTVDMTECGSGGAFVAGVNTGVSGAARLAMDELAPALQVFPVPATDRVSFMIEGMNQPEAIRLYDQQGRMVKQDVLLPALQTGMDVSTLPRGLYTVQVAGQTKRIVLQ